eukprot:m.47458 g.47458  ORF g.47458 m.47458 type:complete len:898 (+) comp10981_c0_seq1:285-2978(+)
MSKAVVSFLRAAEQGDIAALEAALGVTLQPGAQPQRSRSGTNLFNRLRHTPSVTSKNKDGCTALHLAALNGHVDACQLLIKAGANANAQDNTGSTPLHLAAWGNHQQVTQLLLTGRSATARSNIHAKTNDGETALHMACRNGYIEVAKLLAKNGCSALEASLKRETPLGLAAQFGRTDTVRVLLAHTLEAELANSMHQPAPLNLAARNGHVEVVKLLIAAGVKINRVGDHGTALHEATQYCKTDVVRALIEGGADTTAKDRVGNTPLDILESLPPAKTKDIRALLLSGAEAVPVAKARCVTTYVPNVYDQHDLALREGDVITVLDMSQDGYWKGQLGTRIGTFPHSYVELIDEDQSSAATIESPSRSAANTSFNPFLQSVEPTSTTQDAPFEVDWAKFGEMESGSSSEDDEDDEDEEEDSDAGSVCGNSDSIEQDGGGDSDSSIEDVEEGAADFDCFEPCDSEGEGPGKGEKETQGAAQAEDLVDPVAALTSAHSLDDTLPSIQEPELVPQVEEKDELAERTTEQDGSQEAVEVEEEEELSLAEPTTVAEWLDQHQLSSCAVILQQNGFDSLQFLPLITNTTLDAMPLLEAGDKAHILTALRTAIKPDMPPVTDLEQWCAALELPEYVTALQAAGISTHDHILTLDEADLRAAGVDLLGHRTRMLASIEDARGQATTAQPAMSMSVAQQLEHHGVAQITVQYLGSRSTSADPSPDVAIQVLAKMRAGNKLLTDKPPIFLQISASGVDFVSPEVNSVIVAHDVSTMGSPTVEAPNKNMFMYMSQSVSSKGKMKWYCHVFCAESSAIATDAVDVLNTIISQHQPPQQSAAQADASKPEEPNATKEKKDKKKPSRSDLLAQQRELEAQLASAKAQAADKKKKKKKQTETDADMEKNPTTC